MHENIICHLRARARLIFFCGFCSKIPWKCFFVKYNNNNYDIIAHLMTSHGTSGMYCTTTIKNTSVCPFLQIMPLRFKKRDWNQLFRFRSVRRIVVIITRTGPGRFMCTRAHIGRGIVIKWLSDTLVYLWCSGAPEIVFCKGQSQFPVNLLNNIFVKRADLQNNLIVSVFIVYRDVTI